jgi:predicted PolB exonuclease-like 3'-5' exonuclease
MTLNSLVRGEKRASFIALFGEERKFAIPFPIASLHEFMLLFDLTNLDFLHSSDRSFKNFVSYYTESEKDF